MLQFEYAKCLVNSDKRWRTILNASHVQQLNLITLHDAKCTTILNPIIIDKIERISLSVHNIQAQISRKNSDAINKI